MLSLLGSVSMLVLLQRDTWHEAFRIGTTMANPPTPTALRWPPGRKTACQAQAEGSARATAPGRPARAPEST